jgi:hypothetical protein
LGRDANAIEIGSQVTTNQGSQGSPFLESDFTVLAVALPLPIYSSCRMMKMSREEYLTVQQIHRGWTLLGIVVIGILACTFCSPLWFGRSEKSSG